MHFIVVSPSLYQQFKPSSFSVLGWSPALKIKHCSLSSSLVTTTVTASAISSAIHHFLTPWDKDEAADSSGTPHTAVSIRYLHRMGVLKCKDTSQSDNNSSCLCLDYVLYNLYVHYYIVRLFPFHSCSSQPPPTFYPLSPIPMAVRSQKRVESWFVRSIVD